MQRRGVARGAETLRWLSRLYQAQGDEARGLEAAVQSSQYPVAPCLSETERRVEMQMEPTRSRMIWQRTPVFLVILGLGISIGAILWMLMRP